MEDPPINPGGILPLGEPSLRQRLTEASDVRDPALLEDGRRLYRTLQNYRRRYGYGQVLAAPQLGIPRRLLALHLAGWPGVIVDPEITWRSDETVTLWDSCLCFPTLLVRVRRAASVSVGYVDTAGERQKRQRLDTASAELLQHAIDHLNGVLAVDHACGDDPFISRQAFVKHREHFSRQVDFTP